MVVANKRFSVVERYWPNLQDNNSEKDLLELFRERLSNGQVSDRKRREREKLLALDLRERERERELVLLTC